MCSKYQCAANDDDDDVQVHLKKLDTHTFRMQPQIEFALQH